MPNPSNLSVVNLEFLRKEAKSILKRCRSLDPSTLHRIRGAIPRIASFDDRRAGVEVRLADIQHVLAREHGYINWAELKRSESRSPATADYSLPGNDGTLPENFTAWQWGISYTVRPELLSTLVAGQEYRIIVSVLRKVSDAETFSGYKELYHRSTAIAHARADRLAGPGGGHLPHKRILTQGWFRHGTTNLVRAFITLGVTYLTETAAKAEGEVPPSAEQLVQPGGMTPDNTTVTAAHKHFHEAYVEADISDGSGSLDILTLSYGEYVDTVEGLNFQPFVDRAEQLMEFHRRFVNKRLNIIRREWFYATNPNIAVVHVYGQLDRNRACD